METISFFIKDYCHEKRLLQTCNLGRDVDADIWSIGAITFGPHLTQILALLAPHQRAVLHSIKIHLL